MLLDADTGLRVRRVEGGALGLADSDPHDRLGHGAAGLADRHGCDSVQAAASGPRGGHRVRIQLEP